MKLSKRSGVYYLRLRRGGVEEWISTNRKSKRDAEKSAEEIINLFDREKHTKHLAKQIIRYAMSIAKGEISQKQLVNPMAMLEKEAMIQAMGVIESVFPIRSITAEDLWQNYISSGKNIKKSTMQTKQQRFSIFSKWAKDMDMKSLNNVLCKNFLDSLNVSSQTRKNYVSDLSSVFSAYNINNPWTADLRSSGDNQKEEHKERTPVTVEEARAVLKFCDENPEKTSEAITYKRWALFLRTLYYTGLRPVDVCFLQRKEIKDGIIELTPEKTSRTRRKTSYKADNKMIDILGSIEDDGTGFYFPDFRDLYDKCRSNPDHGFKKILKNAKMDHCKFTLYGFRHHYITYQIDSGNDETNVASAVGHVSTETTKNHYYHGRKNVELSELPEI